jgi:hypothetical protein
VAQFGSCHGKPQDRPTPATVHNTPITRQLSSASARLKQAGGPRTSLQYKSGGFSAVRKCYRSCQSTQAVTLNYEDRCSLPSGFGPTEYQAPSPWPTCLFQCQSACTAAADGFAYLNGSTCTTGGSRVTIATVTNEADLERYATSS